jgi:hypothetical protein
VDGLGQADKAAAIAVIIHCSLFICHLPFVIARVDPDSTPNDYWAISEAMTNDK